MGRGKLYEAKRKEIRDGIMDLTRSLPTIFYDVYHIHHIFHDVYHIYYLGPSHMPHDVFIRHSKVTGAKGGHNTSI